MDLDTDKEFGELVKLYQECIGQPNGLTVNWISQMLEKYGFEWCKNTMLIAEEQGKRSKSYVKGILENWKNKVGMQLEKKDNLI
ncbi:DnaD domain protein [Gottschalkia acidurici]|nr:DnaD domain protein [Gottschalkia acidurici]